MTPSTNNTPTPVPDLESFQALVNIAGLLNSVLVLDEVLKRTMDVVIQLTGAERGAVILVSPQGELDMKVLRNLSQSDIDEADFLFSRNILQQVIQSGKPALSVNACGESQYQAFESVLCLKLRSLMCVPLRVKERVIGVIYVDNRLKEGVFQKKDLTLLQTCANQAAIAIENARLYEEVSHTKQFLHDILEEMTSAVVTINEDGLITSCNAVFKSIFNLTHQDLIQQPIEAFEIFVPLLPIVQKGLEQHKTVSGEDIRFRQGSETRYLQVSSSLMTETKHRHTLLLTINDVTQQRQLEVTLARTDRLTAIGQMVASIAHEIRNPLSSIRGFCDILIRKIDPETKEYRFIKLISEETNRLNALTNEWVEYVRGNDLRFKPTNLNEAVRQAIRLMEHELLSHRIRLNKDLTPDLPPVYADKNKLVQALLDLLINSQHAIDNPGGTITLRTFMMNGQTPPRVAIAITDTGCGMTPDVLDRIFDPFFTTKKEGTGLGLAIVNSIIKDHLGKIEVKSQPEHGTTFTISLPIMLHETG